MDFIPLSESRRNDLSHRLLLIPEGLHCACYDCLAVNWPILPVPWLAKNAGAARLTAGCPLRLCGGVYKTTGGLTTIAPLLMGAGDLDRASIGNDEIPSFEFGVEAV